MRLLRANTERLHEFFESQAPPYAILSHCWGADEVTLRDMETETLEWKNKPGYKKIAYACDQAIKDGFEFVWVDTCCIDKNSSAELSEAINSMYRWYQKAKICYAYLEDVDVEQGGEIGSGDSDFGRSRWFTRGWTLQELLAPKEVVFYGKDWKSIGRKSEIAEVISKITSIPRHIVKDPVFVSSASVAQKMSWAADRQTTREEDVAYSLLGIHDVNMPLVYGEGVKAFTRLQEEILRVSTDQSILAWDYDILNLQMVQSSDGILADSPSLFRNSGYIVPIPSGADDESHSMSNKGLLIEVPLLTNSREAHYYQAVLDCQDERDYSFRVSIHLVTVSNLTKTSFFRNRRPDYGKLGRVNLSTTVKTVEARRPFYLVKRQPFSPQQRIGYSEYPRPTVFLVNSKSAQKNGYEITEIMPKSTVWFPETGTLRILQLEPGSAMTKAAFAFHNKRLDSLFYLRVTRVRWLPNLRPELELKAKAVLQLSSSLEPRENGSLHSIYEDGLATWCSSTRIVLSGDEINNTEGDVIVELQEVKKLNQAVLILDVSFEPRANEAEEQLPKRTNLPSRALKQIKDILV
ncbi:hypothetical protein G7Y89_g9445 [Cudoniella acicularis]|uniref:Heterokaryon incompatibility domain-containing protein n=1 Tax=Cudoniella acicularis TaxID=354080 RepID=A0A8H4W041_9HELO|nr:hypothetical protein G7Y89_g9445 [Cudoniella acicularis]